MQSARCSSTPVFVSELGASSGVPTSSAGSAAHQEAVIDGTLKALKAETAVPMNGAIPWIMSPMYVQSSNGFGLVDWNPSYWSPALADLHAYVFPN
jgi:hypothetical protein